MTPLRVLASGVAGAIGCRYDSASGRLVFTEYGGKLSAVDVAQQTYGVLGTGYTEPEDIALLADGGSALVTERTGNLVKVDRRLFDDLDGSRAVRSVGAAALLHHRAHRPVPDPDHAARCGDDRL
jgi:hypothetical protein